MITHLLKNSIHQYRLLLQQILQNQINLQPSEIFAQLLQHYIDNDAKALLIGRRLIHEMKQANFNLLANIDNYVATQHLNPKNATFFALVFAFFYHYKNYYILTDDLYHQPNYPHLKEKIIKPLQQLRLDLRKEQIDTLFIQSEKGLQNKGLRTAINTLDHIYIPPSLQPSVVQRLTALAKHPDATESAGNALLHYDLDEDTNALLLKYIRKNATLGCLNVLAKIYPQNDERLLILIDMFHKATNNHASILQCIIEEFNHVNADSKKAIRNTFLSALDHVHCEYLMDSMCIYLKKYPILHDETIINACIERYYNVKNITYRRKLIPLLIGSALPAHLLEKVINLLITEFPTTDDGEFQSYFIMVAKQATLSHSQKVTITSYLIAMLWLDEVVEDNQFAFDALPCLFNYLPFSMAEWQQILLFYDAHALGWAYKPNVADEQLRYASHFYLQKLLSNQPQLIMHGCDGLRTFCHPDYIKLITRRLLSLLRVTENRDILKHVLELLTTIEIDPSLRQVFAERLFLIVNDADLSEECRVNALYVLGLHIALVDASSMRSHIQTLALGNNPILCCTAIKVLEKAQVYHERIFSRCLTSSVNRSFSDYLNNVPVPDSERKSVLKLLIVVLAKPMTVWDAEHLSSLILKHVDDDNSDMVVDAILNNIIQVMERSVDVGYAQKICLILIKLLAQINIPSTFHQRLAQTLIITIKSLAYVSRNEIEHYQTLEHDILTLFNKVMQDATPALQINILALLDAPLDPHKLSFSSCYHDGLYRSFILPALRLEEVKREGKEHVTLPYDAWQKIETDTYEPTTSFYQRKFI